VYTLLQILNFTSVTKLVKFALWFYLTINEGHNLFYIKDI